MTTDRLLDFVLRNAHITTNVCTREQCRRGYRLARRTVPDYNLIYVDRGVAVWVLEDVPHRLAAGDLLLVPPERWHHGYGATRTLDLLSVHLEVRLPGGQDVFRLLVPPRQQHLPEGSRLGAYLRAAAREFDRGDPALARLMLPGWGRLIGFELFLHAQQQGTLQSQPVDPMVVQLLQVLGEWIPRQPRLAELAARAGYSAQHLNRLFQRALGCTPLQYLLRLKLERATQRLLTTDQTVAAVGREVGFVDPYYFSRVFKQHHGRSPEIFRTAATRSAADSAPASCRGLGRRSDSPF